MRYPNLRYSLDLAHLPHYGLAQRLKLTESALSRRLTGRREFTPAERAGILNVLASLGLSVDPVWLFAEPVPPRVKQGAGPAGVQALAAS